MIPDFVELTYAGGLKLEKIYVRTSAISCIQKTTSDKFGCIIQVMTEKYPVKESYESVKTMISVEG